MKLLRNTHTHNPYSRERVRHREEEDKMDQLDYKIRTLNDDIVNDKLISFLPELECTSKKTHHGSTNNKKSSPYRYPLSMKGWLDLSGIGPIPTSTENETGEPSYIAPSPDEDAEKNSHDDNGRKIKANYVYCKKGPRGEGYYHLETRTAHQALFERLLLNNGNGEQPTMFGAYCNECFPFFFSKSNSKLYKAYLAQQEDYDIVYRIMLTRQSSPIPDDSIAAHERLNNAAYDTIGSLPGAGGGIAAVGPF